jgi:hypothetical protein
MLYFEARFDGETRNVDQFYNSIGIESKNGVVSLAGSLVFFIPNALHEFVVSIELDDLDRAEAELRKLGVEFLDRGFDSSGPFALVKDPAGLIVRLSCSNEGLKNMLRRHATPMPLT